MCGKENYAQKGKLCDRASLHNSPSLYNGYTLTKPYMSFTHESWHKLTYMLLICQTPVLQTEIVIDIVLV